MKYVTFNSDNSVTIGGIRYTESTLEKKLKDKIEASVLKTLKICLKKQKKSDDISEAKFDDTPKFSLKRYIRDIGLT